MPIPDSTPANQDIKDIATQIQTAAEKADGNPMELLSLLRLLEDLHRDIRENFFLGALPTNRQALYALLREIELNGGWPYIPRFKIRDFLEKAESTENRSMP